MICRACQAFLRDAALAAVASTRTPFTPSEQSPSNLLTRVVRRLKPVSTRGFFATGPDWLRWHPSPESDLNPISLKVCWLLGPRFGTVAKNAVLVPRELNDDGADFEPVVASIGLLKSY